jgi:DNA repair exonuclease SbcCD ATPase subunit
MKINQISLKNFGSHQDTVLDVSSINPVVVVGRNGAGKSTLAKDAVTWCLFGRARVSSDDLIRDGENQLEVRLDFQLSDVAYRVVRTRERGLRTALNLFRGESVGNPFDVSLFNGATIAETQEKINQLLCVDYELFVATACLEQGESDHFSRMTPKDAKSVIMAVLRLNDYETYLTTIRKALVTPLTQKAQCETTIKILEALPVGAAEFEKNAPETLALAVKQRDEIELEQTNLSNRAADLAAAKIENRTRYAKVTEQMRGLQDAIGNVEKHEAQLRSGRLMCPLCQSTINESRVELISNTWQMKKAEHRDALDRLRNTSYDLDADCMALDAVLIDHQNTQNRFKETLIALDIEIHRLEKVVAQQQSITDYEENLGDKLLAVKLQLINVTEKIADYELLEKAFGQNGIPALVVENVLPEIEVSASDALRELSDGRLSLSFRTQKELKKGGMGEDFEIIVHKNRAERIYASASGGEKFRVDLAVRIALSKVLARRSSFKLSTLIIDEGMGSLDEEGRDNFVKLLWKLCDYFERIIIVTHTELRDRLPEQNIITVEEHNGISSIKNNAVVNAKVVVQ